MTHFKCFGTVFEGKSNCRSCTPVVVIDPESGSDLSRLIKLILAHGYRFDPDAPDVDLAAALREFANPKPPKPEEPTRLGAVVRDGEGDLFSLNARGVWLCLDGGSAYMEWADLFDPVEVLSKGVPQ